MFNYHADFRRAAVCLELTKQFERVIRGTLSELCEQFKDAKVRGEITVVIAGNNRKFVAEPEEPEEDGTNDDLKDPSPE